MDNIAFYLISLIILLTAILSVVLPNFKYAVYSFFIMCLGISLFSFFEKMILLGFLQIIFYSIIFFIFLFIANKKKFYTKSILKANFIYFLLIMTSISIALYLISLYSVKFEKEYLLKNSLFFINKITPDYFLVFFLFAILVFVISIGTVALYKVKKENKNG